MIWTQIAIPTFNRRHFVLIPQQSTLVINDSREVIAYMEGLARLCIAKKEREKERDGGAKGTMSRGEAKFQDASNKSSS